MDKSIPDAAVSTLNHIAPIPKKSTKTSKANLEEQKAKLWEVLADRLAGTSQNQGDWQQAWQQGFQAGFQQAWQQCSQISNMTLSFHPTSLHRHLFTCNHLHHSATSHSHLQPPSHQHHSITSRSYHPVLCHPHHNVTSHSNLATVLEYLIQMMSVCVLIVGE